jgi:fibronectin type 3 domain-containing protein
MGMGNYLKRTLVILVALVLSVPSLSVGTANAIGEACFSGFTEQNPPQLSTPENVEFNSEYQYIPDFKWDPVTGATSYEICRDGFVVGTTSATSYLDNQVGAGTYVYKVAAIGNSGQRSMFSLDLQIHVDTDIPTISTPILTASQILQGETSTLSIETNDASEISNAYYRVNGGDPIAMQRGGIANVDWHFWNVTFPQGGIVDCGFGCSTTPDPLQNGVYTISVQAFDGVGRPSAVKSVVLTIGLVTPTGLSVVKSPTNSAPVLNWNNQQRADHYNIYRDSNPTPIATSTTPTYTDNSSLADGTHTYKVSAVDDQSNETAQSSAVSVVVDKTAPTATNLVLNPTLILLTGTLSISADANDALSGVTGGEYFVDTDPGQGNATPMTFNSSTGKLTATRSVTSSNTSTGNHTVKVRSKDAAGNWSALVTKTFFKL